MKKMRMSSSYITDQNIAKIGELFPNVLTETCDEQGELKRAIDFELLKQELSDVLVEGDKERYQLTWPGKKKAILNANSPINETLRPVKEDSVDWDNTQNLYIEGDNLEVMKLLQESYLNKVKCIYIDPPYNTGSDFVYKDDYKQAEQTYLEESGQINEEKAIMFQNTQSNGRFHSDWLNIMYERLKISRTLLCEDGVIFISIDDNECSNMQKICDEIFGVQTFIGNFVWKRRASSAMASNLVSTDHEYILCYGKNSGITFKGLVKNYSNYKNPDNDPRGDWTTGDLTVGMNKDQRPNQYYDLIDPLTQKKYSPNPNRVWAFIPESMNKLLAEQRIVFPEDEAKRPMLKRFKNDLRKEVDPISTFLVDVGMNSEGTKAIKEHFAIPIFNYSKPITLVKKLIQQVATNSDIVLDFFSGSATTAESVMELNALDHTQLKFIMIQIQEDLKENAEAQNLGLTNICEIGKERIRRAAKKIKQNINADIDYGFRVYKVASSNMKDIYYTPHQLGQMDLLDLQSNIKEDRNAEDLLVQVMLELGMELSLPMSSKTIDEFVIYDVDHHKLIVCFEENISESVMKQLAAMKPEYAVFRDHSFQDDSARINVHELFKLLSPNTDVRVL